MNIFKFIVLLCIILEISGDPNAEQFKKKLKTGKPFKYHICVITRVNYVDYLLSEWIAYHLRIGVNHFIISYSGSDKGTLTVLEKYEQEGVVTLYKENSRLNIEHLLPNASLQLSHMFGTEKSKCRWMTSIDSNEYLFPSTDSKNVNFLKLVVRKAKIPLIRIMRYDMNLADKQVDRSSSDGPLIGRYNYGNVSPFIKTIVRSELVENWYSANNPLLKSGSKWRGNVLTKNYTDPFLHESDLIFRSNFCPQPAAPIYLRRIGGMSGIGTESVFNGKTNTAVLTWLKETNSSKCALGPSSKVFLPLALNVSINK